MTAARRTATREDLLLHAKTRRYPYARLSRLCTHALLNMTQDKLDHEPLPDAAWLLGFRREARPLLTHISQHTTLISKAADVLHPSEWFRHFPVSAPVGQSPVSRRFPAEDHHLVKSLFETTQ